MKLLSFQPYSLYVNGGSSRILRRLYNLEESNVYSLAVTDYFVEPVRRKINEKIIYATPVQRKWMRWRLRNWASWMRSTVFYKQTLTKIHRAAQEIPYDLVHVINHGPYSAALCDTNKPFWASFHDHYSVIGSSANDASQLWNQAERRLVISSEMGQEYQRQFGHKPFELITDGVTETEISKPIESIYSPITIYFAGLLHIDYLPLFQTLGNVLDQLVEEGLSCKLVLRGTQPVRFLENRRFEVVYLPATIDDLQLKQELDSASILYLPIKFSHANFYQYSLSTKMIGYLGASGVILYHGPGNSAASKLITKAGAGFCCTSLKDSELYDTIRQLIGDPKIASEKAKRLASKEFNLTQIQDRFWQRQTNTRLIV